MDRGPQVEHLYICYTWRPLIRESTRTAGIKCCPIIAVIGIVSLEKNSEKANLPLQSPDATLLRLPNDAFDVPYKKYRAPALGSRFRSRVHSPSSCPNFPCKNSIKSAKKGSSYCCLSQKLNLGANSGPS